MKASVRMMYTCVERWVREAKMESDIYKQIGSYLYAQYLIKL